MKSIFFVLMISIFLVPSSMASDSNDLDRWDASNPPANLYAEGVIPNCAECDTLVINASLTPISNNLAKSFELVASKAGKNHLGVSIKRNQILDFASKLRELKCNLPKSNQDNIVYFVFIPEGQCIGLPYSDQRRLQESLEKMYGYLKERNYLYQELSSARTKNDVSDFMDGAHKFLKDHYVILRDLISAIAARKK